LQFDKLSLGNYQKRANAIRRARAMRWTFITQKKFFICLSLHGDEQKSFLVCLSLHGDEMLCADDGIILLSRPRSGDMRRGTARLVERQRD